MACKACEKNKNKVAAGYFNKNSLNYPPYNATDIQVYDEGLIRKFNADDWNGNRNKLLLFYPETNTPVCQSEMGAINDWIEKFDELNCDVFSVTADPIGLVKQWYEDYDELKNPKYKALSSFQLTSRLGLLHNNRSKRASVIITTEGDVIVQEHFMKVGRSIAELHRTLYAYTTDSYCGEGWTGLEDGFLHDNH